MPDGIQTSTGTLPTLHPHNQGVHRLASGWNHNTHYHGTLLREVPSRCRRALDVGCGEGDVARILAARVHRVDAIDANEDLIRRAREAPGSPPNVSFIVGDFLFLRGRRGGV